LSKSDPKLKNSAGLVNANIRIKSNGYDELLLYENSAGASSPTFQSRCNVLESYAPINASNGDIIFFSAGSDNLVNSILGSLRCKIADDKNLIKDEWKFVWVTDFPMFEHDLETKKWKCLHHPFTMPVFGNISDIEEKPKTLLSKSYDLVLNGTELGGGSIRINSTEVQNSVFKVLGLNKEEIDNQFGFFVESMKYGCPPHGGIAFGLDRIMMLLTKSKSIREVIAFPKTQTASCSLTGAPANISKEQISDLGLKHKSNDIKK